MSRPSAAAAPLDYDVLLEEILLRLPPQPSSLPRASLVCKRWRRILSDPRFHGRFRKHHSRNKPPPLLGFFDKELGRYSRPIFNPTMGRPDRVPPSRFSLSWSGREAWAFLGCRHGLALLISWTQLEAVVWDPLTGHQRRVAIPPEFSNEEGRFVHSAAVMCAASAQDGHVHGDCRFTPFRLALIGGDSDDTRMFACLYDSESGVWGESFSVGTTETMCITSPSILVGDAFCWVLSEGGILEFDFQSQSLEVTEKPADAHAAYDYLVVRTEHGGLGLALLSEYPPTCIQLWERKYSCDGLVGWELQKTIQLDGLFSQGQIRALDNDVMMLGYDEETNEIFLSTCFGDWMLQLESSRFTNLFETQRGCLSSRTYYPYRNFYITGSRDGGVEM